MTDEIVEESVQLGLGLFLFTHLRLAADADEELASLGLHRTHHRILYLAARAPGTGVSEIVHVLRLTPQGVQAPVRRLLRDGLIEQRAPERDRRKREIYLTEKGEKLHRDIAAKQHARVARAYSTVGMQKVDGFLTTMVALLDKSDIEYLQLRDINPAGY